LTREILQHYGYKVLTAAHGADALALFSKCQDKVHAVLMDMMMPVMDGPTAIKELKQRQADLHVIAVSGLMQGDLIKSRLGDPSIPFLAKPYTTEKLLEKVRNLTCPAMA
jgi:CheY-like chemotaxis protein